MCNVTVALTINDRPPRNVVFVAQGVDQVFGRLAAWIARHRTVEDPCQFVDVIQNFLGTLHGKQWPAHVRRSAFRLDVVHDWVAWLDGVGMVLHGHTGPSAPHAFSFLRRESSGSLRWLG